MVLNHDTPVRIRLAAPEPDVQIFWKPFFGRLKAPPIDFVARRARRGSPKRGSSQRFLWQQPFSLKGCYPLRFFLCFERNLSTFPAVRASHSAFVQV